jgi:HEAT repeats
MVVFVALPAFLILLTLVWVPVSVLPVGPPMPHADGGSEDDEPGGESAERFVELTRRIGQGGAAERRRAVVVVAWWTQRCPEYAHYAVPRLASGLNDPDHAVRDAAAVALGALGPDASPALPFLKAARGKGDAYFDHLLVEAAFWIEHGRVRPAHDDECESLSTVGELAKQ